MLVAAITGLALAFSACGGGDDEDTIDVGDGDVTVGEGLPDGWPDDFPVYDGADLQGGARGDVDGTEGMIATWTTGDDADQVSDFYEEELSDGPWKSVGTTNVADGALIAFEHESDNRGGSVVIGGDGDDTSIIVSIAEGLDLDDDDSADGDGSDDGTDGDDGSTSDETPTGGDQPTEADLPDEVDLPDTYPADQVPLPDDAHVSSAASSTAGGVGSHVVQFYSEDSVEELDDYFKTELEGNGFTQQLRTEQDGGVFATYGDGDDPSSGTIVLITMTESEVPGYSSTSLQITETP
jgi:hypothetical protein